MPETGQAPYSIAGRQVLLETPQARVVLMTLATGESTPWHRHSQVADTTLVLTGEVEVRAREPEEIIRLEPGVPCRLEPGRPHCVANAGEDPCRFLLIQGVGTYDFVKI